MNMSFPFLDNWLLRRLSCVLTSSLDISRKCVLIGVVHLATEPLIKMLFSLILDFTDLGIIIPI